MQTAGPGAWTPESPSPGGLVPAVAFSAAPPLLLEQPLAARETPTLQGNGVLTAPCSLGTSGKCGSPGRHILHTPCRHDHSVGG